MGTALDLFERRVLGGFGLTCLHDLADLLLEFADFVLQFLVVLLDLLDGVVAVLDALLVLVDGVVEFVDLVLLLQQLLAKLLLPVGLLLELRLILVEFVGQLLNLVLEFVGCFGVLLLQRPQLDDSAVIGRSSIVVGAVALGLRGDVVPEQSLDLVDHYARAPGLPLLGFAVHRLLLEEALLRHLQARHVRAYLFQAF